MTSLIKPITMNFNAGSQRDILELINEILKGDKATGNSIGFTKHMKESRQRGDCFVAIPLNCPKDVNEVYFLDTSGRHLPTLGELASLFSLPKNAFYGAPIYYLSAYCEEGCEIRAVLGDEGVTSSACRLKLDQYQAPQMFYFDTKDVCPVNSGFLLVTCDESFYERFLNTPDHNTVNDQPRTGNDVCDTPDRTEQASDENYALQADIPAPPKRPWYIRLARWLGF